MRSRSRTSEYCRSWHSPCDGGRDDVAKAGLFQPFVGDGVRPILKRKIKSNQIRVFCIRHQEKPGNDPGVKVDEEEI
jgi:hypothetical protein